MNCREFQDVVQDLARTQAIDALAVKTGMAHAFTCGPCAERLEEERSLGETLQRLAQSASAQEAPRRVEGVLLATFRQQHRAAQGVRLRRAAWAVGAAAAVLAISFTLWHGWPSPKKDGRKAAAAVAVSEPPKPFATSVPASGQEAPASLAVSKRAYKRVAARKQPDEFAQGFVPLPYADTYGPLEGGEIVRVELGRAALESLGFTVAGAEADQQVLADVLVGQDGLPRAIRFVD